MNKPTISIIMAVYNCEDTVKEAIDSLISQTYEDWELILCNDASTDRTSEIIAEIAKRMVSNSVTILNNEVNSKLAYSLNRCLEVAQGDFIARMDADDISNPERLEKQMHYLESHPEIDMVGTSMRRFNNSGLGDIVEPASSEPDKWIFMKSSRVPFCHATILARRSVFETVGNYTVSWRTERGQDVDLWYKFFAAGLQGRNLNEALYLVREDSAAIRRRTRKARIGGFVTQVVGSKSLGYPLPSYLRYFINLLKIFIPYSFFDVYRRFTAFRNKS